MMYLLPVFAILFYHSDSFFFGEWRQDSLLGSDSQTARSIFLRTPTTGEIPYREFDCEPSTQLSKGDIVKPVRTPISLWCFPFGLLKLNSQWPEWPSWNPHLGKQLHNDYVLGSDHYGGLVFGIDLLHYCPDL